VSLAPLGGANVQAIGSVTAVATTQPSGSYTLANLAAGTYAVTASDSGYQSLTETIGVVSGHASEADFPLRALTPTRTVTPSPVPTIQVGGFPYVLAVNPATNKVYVGDLIAHVVTAIDVGNGNALSTVAIADRPQGVAANPATNLVYVTGFGTNTVTVIDAGNGNATSVLAVGTNPNGIAVNPATNKVYVADESDKALTVIDAGHGNARSTIPLRAGP